MKKYYSHYLKTLKFWRAVEAFNLPDLIIPRRNEPKYHVELKHNDKLPWELPRYASSEPNLKWKHTIYFGCLPKEKIMDVIRQYLKDKSEVFDMPQTLTGQTWMTALVVDALGKPYDNTYTRAAFTYALKALVENKSFDEITEWLKKSQEEYNSRFKVEEAMPQKQVGQDDGLDFELVDYEEEKEEEEQHEKNPAVTWVQLVKELDALKDSLPNALKENLVIICISEKIAKSTEPEVPFMNSFYTNDLNTIIEAVRNEETIGQPLQRYLQQEPVKDGDDLQNSYNLIQYLDPGYLSPARWPANPKFGLYSAQLAAVNLSLCRLKTEDDLIGINGPPGTGKTTLLREIIADIILSRAQRLMKYEAKDLFERKWMPLANTGYYEINSEVFGNDGIVIASNNNAAVANISEELPRTSSIDKNAFPHADYMDHVAAAVCGDENCWGMLSAALGNASNCSRFMGNYWKASGLSQNLYELNNKDDEKKYIDAFEEAKYALSTLLNQFKVFKQVAEAYHEGLMCELYPEYKGKKISASKLQELKKQLQHDYQIPVANIPDQSYTRMPMTEIHKLNPYSSEKVNKLRSEIFLKSLDLHLYAILANAKHFRANVDLFLNMLIGKHANLITEDITHTLWQTFFFCVPVISSSLASIERFMKKLNRESFGWLLLDEAGQATPQSAVGAIWRAQRAIIIGDTMQVPPVVTMPDVLGKVLQDYYQIESSDWSPIYQSAQFLADRVTPFGTHIHNKWTGIPLRAHRRCADPMFSIANKIAYNDQMVKVTKDGPLDICLRESAWINVKGTTVDGHFIEEEFEVLKKLIESLERKEDYREIFIISPFRTVLAKPYSYFSNHGNIKCGTIHTFQGKEADIVFILLGSDPARPGARQWVAQTPNMLNVAITRAKKYVYFIGNKDLWQQCSYFKDVIEKLPIRDLKPKTNTK